MAEDQTAAERSETEPLSKERGVALSLAPRTVTIASQFKAFGLDKGMSDGTEMSITFDIPSGLEGPQLRRAMLAEKLKLDLLTLSAEWLKGSIQEDIYKHRRDTLRQRHEQAQHESRASRDSAG